MPHKNKIRRDPRLYTLGKKQAQPKQSPFYRQALLFDGTGGKTSVTLIRSFNKWLKTFKRYRESSLLKTPGFNQMTHWPRQIIIINASNDRLPLSWETARIIRTLLKAKARRIPVYIVDTQSELLKRLDRAPDQTLVLSQCVDKKAYHVDLLKKIQTKMRSAVFVPGAITAPGGIFSDKAKTYRLCSKTQSRLVPQFKRVGPRKKGGRALVRGIFRAINQLEREHGFRYFFVKPTEGGGGLGGFRISRVGKRFFLPDLSKVSGNFTEVKPSYLTFPLANRARIRELVWISQHFAKSPLLKEAYLEVTLSALKKKYRKRSDLAAMHAYLAHTQTFHAGRIHEMSQPRHIVERRMIKAFNEFEKKYRRRYVATVNKHISFGTWGLRAHYRMGTRGPILESLYARIFQLAFTKEGVGYVGSDNISNKQTGKLEVTRLVPLNPIMVMAVGGKKKLFQTLEKGLKAMMLLRERLPKTERDRMPLRVQMDLAPVEGLIGEGNADTARGMSLATRWEDFIANAEEWASDALCYYDWRHQNR